MYFIVKRISVLLFLITTFVAVANSVQQLFEETESRKHPVHKVVIVKIFQFGKRKNQWS